MKVYLILNGYNNPKVIHDSLTRLHEQTDMEGIDIEAKILIDSLYPFPLHKYNEIRSQFEKLAFGFNFILWRLTENLGQNGNFNVIVQNLLQTFKPNREDVIAFWEPDSNVTHKSWLKDCLTLFEKAYHPCGFITPGRMPAWIIENQGEERVIEGIKVRQLSWPGGWPMGIYRWGFIEDMQQMPMSHDYYGGTEGNIMHKLNVTNHIGLMMTEVLDPGLIDGFDPEYIGWKAETIRLPKGQQLEFGAWIKKKTLPSSNV